MFFPSYDMRKFFLLKFFPNDNCRYEKNSNQEEQKKFSGIELAFRMILFNLIEIQV